MADIVKLQFLMVGMLLLMLKMILLSIAFIVDNKSLLRKALNLNGIRMNMDEVIENVQYAIITFYH
jgi:hypothetical protein